MIRIVPPGSGCRLSPIQDSGSRGQKCAQSRFRFRNTVETRIKFFVFIGYEHFCRHEDSGECNREMESMKEMGEQFYAESGDLMKLVGILRATDIHWNEAKR